MVFRNVSQAGFFDRLLQILNQGNARVVNLEVPDEVLIARLDVVVRDDTESVIRNRLQVYREQTAPLIDLLRSPATYVS